MVTKRYLRRRSDSIRRRRSRVRRFRLGFAVAGNWIALSKPHRRGYARLARRRLIAVVQHVLAFEFGRVHASLRATMSSWLSLAKSLRSPGARIWPQELVGINHPLFDQHVGNLICPAQRRADQIPAVSSKRKRRCRRESRCDGRRWRRFFDRGSDLIIDAWRGLPAVNSSCSP